MSRDRSRKFRKASAAGTLASYVKCAIHFTDNSLNITKNFTENGVGNPPLMSENVFFSSLAVSSSPDLRRRPNLRYLVNSVLNKAHYH